MSGVKSRLSASDQPEALAARQREHRLRERIRPKLPVLPNADPWVVCDEGLDAIDRIRFLVHPQGQVLEELDLAAERLRRLAWGPEEDFPGPLGHAPTAPRPYGAVRGLRTGL